MVLSIRVIRLLISSCAILLGVGISAPCMTIYPNYGGFTSVVKLIKPEITSPQSFSILESVTTLFHEGEVFVALVILIFSIIFPVWKLGVLWDSTTRIRTGGVLQDELKWVDQLGKFSMVDIFVLALIVVAVKGLPGGTSVSLAWGVYFFSLSIFISMLVPRALRRL